MSRAQVTITMECAQDDRGDRPDDNDEDFWPSKDPDAADYVFSENYETQMELAQERMNAWRNGEWEYIGVRAVADIKVPYGRDWITTRIKSPGLWGIESDAGADYLAEVFEEEKATLFEMLASLKEFELA